MESPELTAAVERLWQRAFPGEERAFGSREFHQLVRACERRYRHLASSDSYEVFKRALHIYFRNQGAPWNGHPSRSEETAQSIENALLQKDGAITYLLPLDGSPELPEVSFGHSRLTRFTQSEFETMVGAPRIRRFNPVATTDYKGYAQFRWLTVQTRKPLPSLARRMGRFPGFFLELGLSDVGKVLPHRSKYPIEIEQSLCAILLFPWEDVINLDKYSPWEPFQVPWHLQISDDPLQQPVPLPGLNTLSWTPLSVGEDDLVEVPLQNEVEDHGLDDFESKLQGNWTLLESVWPSNGTPHKGFPRLVSHFFLKAFEEQGIDQFISHNSTIDAALYVKGRSASQIEKLLDAEAEKEYRRLYNVRSEYIHGREVAGEVWESDLRSMRRMTRRVVFELLKLLSSNPTWIRSNLKKYLKAH